MRNVTALTAMLLFAAALVPQASMAQDAIEVRAAKVCAGIGSLVSKSQGEVTVDNLELSTTGNGTVSISRDGVDLGKVNQAEYKDYVSCLTTVIGLLSPQPKPLPPTVTYRVCSGEYERACKPHDVYLYCYADVKSWAAARCESSIVQRMNTYAGNKCGYSIDTVVCTSPK
ncbi:hypothetical protein [Rhizobium laguerreae]|uniref:hypothetical protein n=1 Tax=Rhizobium laguerreae TaxID=1076926 RepID=UPI001C914AAA|nr:hypothetical protein [Rhizobium laguerreae]MBY3249877.1 hypothetical protein [Rhizobium laguerreae]